MIRKGERKEENTKTKLEDIIYKTGYVKSYKYFGKEAYFL